MTILTRLRVTAAAAALAMPLAAPASAADITLFRFFGECANEYGSVTDVSKAVGECGIIQALTNKFNAENTISAKVVTQTVDWGTYYDLLSATYSTGNIPDVAVMHGSTLPNFVARDLVEPIGEDLAAAGVDVDDFTQAARAAVTVDDTVYGLPFDVHALLMHVNVGLLAEAGLVDAEGDPMLPKTPEELLEQGRQFKEKTGKTYVAIESDAAAAMTVRLFNSFVWQQGSNIIRENGSRLEPAFDSPEALKAAEFIKTLYDEGLSNKALDYAGAEQAFMNGEAGILVNGTWVVDAYAAHAESDKGGLDNYLVANMPPLFGKPAVWGDSHMWAIPTDPNRPAEEREAAIAFLKFLNDNNYEWSRTGHLTVRQSVLDFPEFQALPHREEFAGTSEIATGLPGLQNQRNIQDVMLSEITAMWLVGSEPADVLASMQSRVGSTLRRAR